MPRFVRTSSFPETPGDLFAWHARPGALTRLTPPWRSLRRLGPEVPLEEGRQVHLQLRMGPCRVPWTALHREVIPGESFVDEMLVGPFARWVHRHGFRSAGEGAELSDDIDYELPGGALAGRLAEPWIASMLERDFAWRHDLLRRDLERHRTFADRPRWRVAITGGTGMIGRQLGAFLATGGHQVHLITRNPRPESTDIGWDPSGRRLDVTALEGLDAVVHLAGEPIAGRWTTAHKNRILRSRVEGTLLLSQALASLKRPPRVLVSSSAIGYYGGRGDEPLPETRPSGTGFLAEVCRGWEAATAPAQEAGIRVVHIRTGLVLTPAGGALASMLLPFRLGLGGPVGSGRQFWSWISADDLLGVFHHALGVEGLRGPVNAVAGACPNRDFVRTLGRVLGRPAVLHMPAVVVRTVLGEMGEELLLAGARVVPEQLRASCFRFQHPDLESALRHVLGRARS